MVTYLFWPRRWKLLCILFMFMSYKLNLVWINGAPVAVIEKSVSVSIGNVVCL